MEETYLSILRREIEEQYSAHPTGCGGSFGEILCWELHENRMTFAHIAAKWTISLATLGDLIKDHCDRLQPVLKVNHSYIH